MLLFLLCILTADNTTGLVMGTEYELPLDRALIDPHFMDYSPAGDLYLLERNTAVIHRWKADGTYVGSFASKGQGPGELDSPRLIHVTADQVWVWDPRSRFSIFDHEGAFIKSIPSPQTIVRRFVPLEEDRIFFSFQLNEGAKTNHYFGLADEKGNLSKGLMRIQNEAFIGGMKGDDQGTVKAYGPESDVHSDKKGTVWFGFSEEKGIHQLNRKGKVEGEKTYQWPTSEPSKEERQAFLDIEVPGPDGLPITLEKVPGLSFSFDYPKAYYTHLLITDDKVAGIMTPVSGNDQYKGYFRGTYTIMDRDSGKLLSKGRFDAPKGSLVLFNNGRAIACLLDDEDEFYVREVHLEGMTD